MQSIQILINGAFGNMGKMACCTLEEDPRFDVVGKIGRSDSLPDTIAALRPDIVLDFTDAFCVFKNAIEIVSANVRPIIGTSGLMQSESDHLAAVCARKQLGGAFIPNFSMGAVLTAQYAQHCARYFSDVEIIEMHHPKKVDAPSGTAINTAALLAENRNHASDQKPADKKCAEGARGAACHGIPVHAVRMPGILAQQQILFGKSGETVSFVHNVSDRKAYAAGILLVCKAVMDLRTFVHGLEHFLTL